MVFMRKRRGDQSLPIVLEELMRGGRGGEGDQKYITKLHGRIR